MQGFAPYALREITSTAVATRNYTHVSATRGHICKLDHLAGKVIYVLHVHLDYVLRRDVVSAAKAAYERKVDTWHSPGPWTSLMPSWSESNGTIPKSEHHRRTNQKKK